jgi:hypothetical protein
MPRAAPALTKKLSILARQPCMKLRTKQHGLLSQGNLQNCRG